MFERFSERARRVVVLSQEEARLLDHNWIGTEHLLLGVLALDEGAAFDALAALGVTLDATRRAVADALGRGSEVPVGHIPFTPRAKTVLEYSLREAFDLKRNTIGPEHILLGLLREGQGVAVQLLEAAGVSPGDLRREVLERAPGRVPRPRAEPRSLRAVLRRSSTREPIPASGVRFGARRCSFCLRSEDRVERLVRGRTAWICDECVGRAAALVADAGEDAPKQLRLHAPAPPGTPAPDAEVETVAQAFVTVFGSGATVDERLALIEDSGDLRKVVNQVAATARVSGDFDVWVDTVRFISRDEAEVHWSPLLAGGGRMPMHGFAVLDGGVWKVSRTSYHQIASLAGVAFPLPESRPDPGPGRPPDA